MQESPPTFAFSVRISYVEIYMENMRDLLTRTRLYTLSCFSLLLVYLICLFLLYQTHTCTLIRFPVSSTISLFCDFLVNFRMLCFVVLFVTLCLNIHIFFSLLFLTFFVSQCLHCCNSWQGSSSTDANHGVLYAFFYFYLFLLSFTVRFISFIRSLCLCSLCCCVHLFLFVLFICLFMLYVCVVCVVYLFIYSLFLW